MVEVGATVDEARTLLRHSKVAERVGAAVLVTSVHSPLEGGGWILVVCSLSGPALAHVAIDLQLEQVTREIQATLQGRSCICATRRKMPSASATRFGGAVIRECAKRATRRLILQ